ncbi:DUF4116 domain-containing protein [Burkholderia contaminans]|uniref:DUF4116 domain-containing protein n=1 Tax=Burkholderia contaminans TaxID=488447 RepID=UPI00158E0150|nr:DUF4116 domain-containing protein [Burkholderia contaminans]
MSELTSEEFQERLSVDGGEIFYTANDGETYQIGTYEMQTDWYVKDHSSGIADAYLLDNLYQGTPLYSDDEEIFSISDMASRELKDDIEDFLETYFNETGIDCDIFSVFDNASIDLDAYDLPEEVIEELEHFDEDDMVEAFRNAELLGDDYDYFHNEAKKEYAEHIRDEVKSKMNIQYENGSYPLSGAEIDYSRLETIDVLRDVLGESSAWDSHRKLFLTAKKELLIEVMNDFIEVVDGEIVNHRGSVEDCFEVDALAELLDEEGKLVTSSNPEFFLSHAKSDYGPDNSMLIMFASDEILSDKEFARKWLEASNNAGSIRFFSEEIRNDLEIWKVAVYENKSQDYDSKYVTNMHPPKELLDEYKRIEGDVPFNDFIDVAIDKNRLEQDLNNKPSKADRLVSSIDENAEAPTKQTKSTRQKI